MSGEEKITLLREIRDLQSQQLEYLRVSAANQQQALTNQRQTLAVQQEAVDRQKRVLAKATKLWIFVLLGTFALLFLSFFPFFFKLLLGH